MGPVHQGDPGGHRINQRKSIGAQQFKPNEQVLVELSPDQVSLFDAEKQQAVGATGQNGQELLGDAGEEEEFISFIEDEEQSDEKVRKEWSFG